MWLAVRMQKAGTENVQIACNIAVVSKKGWGLKYNKED